MKTLSLLVRTFVLSSVAALLFAGSLCAGADESVNPVLRPPKGAPVAIVVFEDLQCPQCRRVSPILEQASRTYKIPLVRHDFPLPMHNWSYNAAVMARYFDSISKSIGNEFRDYIFANQLEINPQNLRSYAERFAADRPRQCDPHPAHRILFGRGAGRIADQMRQDRKSVV